MATTLTGYAPIGADHDLTVHFEYSVWQEPHEFWGAPCSETMAEAEPTSFELDEKPIEWDPLVERFGREELETAVDIATENGIDNAG